MPRLDRSVLANDEQLLDAIEELLTDDAAYKGLRKKLLKRQQRLKKLSTDEAWRTYLRIEEVVNARAEHVVLSVVRWAFEQGASSGKPPRGSSGRGEPA